MNKLTTMTGWLVEAAAWTKTLAMGLTIVSALAMTTTSCSSENDMVEASVQPTASTTTMHVTVGAGIGEETTRSDVTQVGTNRTLKFTEGDQLFVLYNGEIGSYGYNVYGTLTTISNISNDGTTAQFSGDLTVNKWYSGQPGPDPTAIPDPDLSQLNNNSFARLLPANHGASLVFQNDPYDYRYREGLTATETLNQAIARHSSVTGTLDAQSNVTLTAKSTFLNCTVTGLEAGKSYDVWMTKGEVPVSVTADGNGKLNFVAWFEVDEKSMAYNIYIGDNKRVKLGEKTLSGGKVYNVNRAAETFSPLTVTDIATGKPREPEYGSYSFKDGNADITVTGEGEGETIILYGGNNTVHLNGVTAISGEAFIYGEQCTLNIVLDGTNSITTHSGQAISTTGMLKLSGNGSLTVTVTDLDFYGLRGSNYNDTNHTDASVLAADGYTVTRSAVTDNNDGTYTFTYTVE
jgi:hypothetical protein